MAKINYTLPANTNLQLPANVRAAFGPGLSVGMTQRAAELSISPVGANTRQR